jgi:hypothetical protein
MKTITFRPLRRIKKTGKITVLGYSGWRKVITADYAKFNLIVNDEYKTFPLDEYVYDHNGELLFFWDYNPADVPIFHRGCGYSYEQIKRENKYFGIQEEIGFQPFCVMDGADCEGIPTFSHWTTNYVAEYWKDVMAVTPLTVEIVLRWHGWFLYRLNNSYLKIGL